MLALTLKVGQKIEIGDSGVYVELLRGGKGQIRLGVTAPKDQKIKKGEETPAAGGDESKP